MRRALAVACLLALLGAHQADAKVIADDGCCSHPRPPSHTLKRQTGILASPAPQLPQTALGGGASSLTATQVASYARGAGFPGSIIPTMVAIAARESAFIPDAVNLSSGACGLWQLYPCPGIQALDPATNAAGAYAKWVASGLAPWGM